MTGNPPKVDEVTIVLYRAADTIEQVGRYNFNVCDLPGSCQDTACVLGWIAYFAGTKPCAESNLDPAAQFLGYEDQGRFYNAMTVLCGSPCWTDDAVLAAEGLRRMARARG